MRNSRRILVIVLIMLIIPTILQTISFAEDNWITKNIDSITSGAEVDDSDATNSVKSIISAAIAIVQIVGTGVAIIMLLVLAMKYMSAAPSDKAEIKKHAVVYVVGAIIFFGATELLKIISNFASSNISSS